MITVKEFEGILGPDGHGQRLVLEFTGWNDVDDIILAFREACSYHMDAGYRNTARYYNGIAESLREQLDKPWTHPVPAGQCRGKERRWQHE